MMSGTPVRGGGSLSATDKMRFAIPKGALFAESVAALQEAGMDVEALRDPGRQLLIETPDIDYLIGKPSDIPIYVAYGAADVGIAGKDTLVESALDVVEMLDLGFGACRFVVAEPEDARRTVEEQYRHLGVVRVATKYPRVTEEYFARRGIQVEVLKINGNIEVAPLIGIADQIVDITQTGRTLRENGLRVVEEVLASSARFIANPVSLRTRSEHVTSLAHRLADVSVQWTGTDQQEGA